MNRLKNLIFVSIAFVLMSVSANADIKSTAYVTSTDKGVNVTLAAPFGSTVFAGTLNGTINGVHKSLYCIDLNHYLEWNAPYQDVSSTDSLLTYVLNNYYPFKAYPYAGSLSTVEKEAAAVQLSLWHFSDALNINGCTVDASVKTRALAIVADAVANAHTFSLNSFAIDIPPQSFTVGSPVHFTVQAFDNLGIAMPNVAIVLSTSAGTLSTTTTTTGPTGVTPVITLTPGPGVTSATITASGTVGIPAGTKYYHVANPSGKQKLILATPTIDSRTINRTVTWHDEIQLTVEKTADKSSANDGDIINYSILVKNIGATNAENIEVSDQLPAILQYISSTPVGEYNSLTGIWSVGDLAAGASKTLTIKTKVQYSNPSAHSFNLGPVDDFNFFVLDTLEQPSADTEGKLAVGGYCNLTGYSVGDKLPPHSGNVLVCGDHLTYMIGRVYNGKAIYQNHITSTMGFSADDGIFRDSVIDFAAAKIYLNNLSAQLAALIPTDTVAYVYTRTECIGNRSGLNVFHIDGAQLLSRNEIKIVVPPGSTVLLNVSGEESRLFGGFSVDGTTKDKVFVNFYEAKKLHFSGIDVKASVLAPKADLTFPAGVVTGQLIVRKMYGSGQINLCPFTGVLTRDTSIVNFAEVTNACQGSNPSFFNAPPSSAVVSSFKTTDVKPHGSMNNIKELRLEQNYPNPFNPSTKIRFSVLDNSDVKVAVYNMMGEEVAVVAQGNYSNGTYEVVFDASKLTSGVYLCRMTARSYTAVQKMILQK